MGCEAYKPKNADILERLLVGLAQVGEPHVSGRSTEIAAWARTASTMMVGDMDLFESGRDGAVLRGRMLPWAGCNRKLRDTGRPGTNEGGTIRRFGHQGAENPEPPTCSAQTAPEERSLGP